MTDNGEMKEVDIEQFVWGVIEVLAFYWNHEQLGTWVVFLGGFHFVLTVLFIRFISNWNV